MLSQLWLLLLLSLLTLQGPQPSTGMGYKTQSNVELLENDSRYISYQGRFHSRWGLSKITRNCVNCKAINQVGHLRTVRTVNWVDVSQSSKWGFESLHSIAQCSVNRCHSIHSTHLPTCWWPVFQQWSRFKRIPPPADFMTPQYIRVFAAFNQKKLRVLLFV